MVSTAVVAGVVAALVVVVGVTGLVTPVVARMVVACRVELEVVAVAVVLVHDAATSENATSPVHSARFQFLLYGSRLFMFTPYISSE
jgi:cobalamin-dependent methionine synthase I